MKLRRTFLILAILVIAFILAFFLQDVIRQVLVTPLAYLWWVFRIAYAAVPQLMLWIVLVAGLALVILGSLVSWFSVGKKPKETEIRSRGNVEILAGLVLNAEGGNYYKWMIANRLAKLWAGMSGRKGDRRQPVFTGQPDFPGHKPSDGVGRYLKAGMAETFVDYPLPRRPFMRKLDTPFDYKLDEVVDFLESQMEETGEK